MLKANWKRRSCSLDRGIGLDGIRKRRLGVPDLADRVVGKVSYLSELAAHTVVAHFSFLIITW